MTRLFIDFSYTIHTLLQGSSHDLAGWGGQDPADLHGQGLSPRVGDDLSYRCPSLHGNHHHHHTVTVTVKIILIILIISIHNNILFSLVSSPVSTLV